MVIKLLIMTLLNLTNYGELMMNKINLSKLFEPKGHLYTAVVLINVK